VPQQGFFGKKANAYRHYEKTDHWAKEHPNRNQEKKAEAHLV
jgi:hypothetical protein